MTERLRGGDGHGAAQVRGHEGGDARRAVGELALVRGVAEVRHRARGEGRLEERGPEGGPLADKEVARPDGARVAGGARHGDGAGIAGEGRRKRPGGLERPRDVCERNSLHTS